LHASIATAVRTGNKPELTETQRAALREVFGDEQLLEDRSAIGAANSQLAPRNPKGAEPRDEQGDRDPEMVRPAPGSRANSHARLANAIRVRRAQIAELRDQAIESGDQKLLERADQFEKTLEIFLQNQARVEANLSKAGMRDRETESLLKASAESPIESPRFE
jgi:hypothetical protein